MINIGLPKVLPYNDGEEKDVWTRRLRIVYRIIVGLSVLAYAIKEVFIC